MQCCTTSHRQSPPVTTTRDHASYQHCASHELIDMCVCDSVHLRTKRITQPLPTRTVTLGSWHPSSRCCFAHCHSLLWPLLWAGSIWSNRTRTRSDANEAASCHRRAIRGGNIGAAKEGPSPLSGPFLVVLALTRL
jgi:hypothetical protein